MSQVKLAAAKELIQEKRYAEARALLQTINNPISARWLEQLERIAPQSVPLPTPNQTGAPPPLQSYAASPTLTEAERYYKAETRKRQRRRLGSGLELIIMGVGSIGLAVYLASLPKATLPGSNPPNDTLSFVLIAVGVLLILTGAFVIRRRKR